MVRTQLDTEVYHHHQLYYDMLYYMISEVMSVLRVASLGLQAREKYMMILDMGYPIASRCSVILVLLSRNLNIIFFQLGSCEVETKLPFVFCHKLMETELY